jgi:hypothetical protein
MVLKARVYAADLQDRAAVPLVLNDAAEEFPRLEHLWVDQGYAGTEPAEHGSRSTSDGVSRWLGIRRKHVENGKRSAISRFSLLCGLNGFDFHLNRRDFAARYRGAGTRNEPSVSYLGAEG